MRVDWEAVVGTGSLKMSNLGKNLKLLKEKEIKQSTGEFIEHNHRIRQHSLLKLRSIIVIHVKYH